MKNRELRVALWGKHSNRTPFYYPTYRRLLEESLSYVDITDEPHVIITGFSKDLADQARKDYTWFLRFKRTKFLVISEEPLWDTIYAKNYQTFLANNTAEIKGTGIRFNFFNHSNSDIFTYETTPYFITTSIDFLARYRVLLTNVIESLGTNVVEPEKCLIFGLFEKRFDEWFRHEDNSSKCLCIYRSLLSESVGSRGTFGGLGHQGSTTARQTLPDWHLDKISKSYLMYKYIVAIENTCQRDYVTEKIFDAYAAGAIPLYYAPADHTVRTKLRLRGFFDVSQLSPSEVFDLLEANTSCSDFKGEYMNDIRCLLRKTLDPTDYWQEIRCRSKKLVNLLHKVLDGF